MTMSCTLFFTGGAKGGSGKTTAGKFLITYLQAQGEVPLLMDLDDENHTLACFFPEALRINLHQEFAKEVLIEKTLSGDQDIIVADLKARTGHEVLKWFLDLTFDELKERGVQLVCLGSVTSAPDSVSIVFELGCRTGSSRRLCCLPQPQGLVVVLEVVPILPSPRVPGGLPAKPCHTAEAFSSLPDGAGDSQVNYL
jgi:hypothetical protein